MGKGRILSAAGDGLYTIEIIEDRARAESTRASAVTRVSDLTDRIATLEQEVVALQSAVDQAVSAQDAAINLYQQEMAAEGSSEVDLAGPAQAVIQAAAERDKVRGQIAQLQLEKLGLEATIARIDALPPLRQVQAWCADYTEDLAGEVATAEVPGEIGQVVIKPGFEDGAAWSPTTDGAMQPALSSTPAGVFYHLAMMPGWQKWRPTFRIATIDSIDGDLCDITLDAANSRFQNLNVNLSPVYDGVPIYYMDCHGAAFEVGDRVLVAFSGNTGAPMVVGFEKEPRECGPECLVVVNVENGWNTYGPGESFLINGDARGEFRYRAQVEAIESSYGEKIADGRVVVARANTDSGNETRESVDPIPEWVSNTPIPRWASRIELADYQAIIDQAIAQHGRPRTFVLVTYGFNSDGSHNDRWDALVDIYGFTNMFRWVIVQDFGINNRYDWIDAVHRELITRGITPSNPDGDGPIWY